MDRPLERQVEKWTCDRAAFRGCACLKLNVKGRVGWPDRLFIFHGKVLFIEFKRLGEKPTLIQQYVHAEIRAHGVPVEVVDNVGDAGRVIDEFTSD